MGKSFLLARANIRKAKSQTAAMTVLILLAALMLNLWLMLSMDYKANFDRTHDRLNAEHVIVATSLSRAKTQDFLEETLTGDKRTAEYCIDDALLTPGSLPYNGGEIALNLVFLEKQTALSRPVGKVEIIEEGSEKSGIYLPVIYKSDDTAIGKTIEITISNSTKTYTVCGYFNSAMAGSHNCALCEFLLTKDKYDELKKTKEAPESTLCSVRIKEKADNEDFCTMLVSAVNAHSDDTSWSVCSSYTLVSQTRYISQMICSGILSAMAFFILLIALVVISSNIINYIQENMKNLGALKAIGYTGPQLTHSLLLQFLLFATTAAAVGTGISYCVFPFLNRMMVAQTGIPYTVRFQPLPVLFTFCIICGPVALVVWLSSRRMQKTEPIAALRQGVLTHNFRKNHVPLAKTKAPLSAALALKTTFSGMKQNISICTTMLMISLILVFSGLMYCNVIVDRTLFIDLIVGAYSDAIVNVTAEAEEEFLHAMNADKQVEKIYLYTQLSVVPDEGPELLASICDDFSKAIKQNYVFEGRFPKYENEIALGAKYAKEYALKTGDEITLSAGGKEAKYIITGFTQNSNNLGRDCLITRDGYERMAKMTNATYSLNLSEDTDLDAFLTRIQGEWNNSVLATANMLSVIESVSSVYITLITVIVVVILILSAIVITFVLYLLVRTLLARKKQDYGILKALGFTTGQLILQTALSFMPAIAVSAVFGIGISCLVINPLLSVFLSGIGIVKCSFPIPAGFIITAGAGLVVFAFVIACLLSLRIRKISPRTLLAGE